MSRTTGASAGGRPLLRVGTADRPAEHPGHEARLGLVGGRARPDDATVAQDGDDVGQVEDLGQEVGDEDHRAAARPQPADDLVQALDLHGRQARRRLVEDDEVGVAGERPQDLDLLLRGDRQVPDDGPGLEVEAGVRDQPVEPLAERPAIDEAGALAARRRGTRSRPRSAAGRGRPPGRRARSRARAPRGGAERDGRPAQDQVALILREDAGDDLAEGGLAGTVLADEGVDGARRGWRPTRRRGPGSPRRTSRAHESRGGRPASACIAVSRSATRSDVSPATPRAAGRYRRWPWSRRHRRAATRAGRHPGPACRTGWRRSGSSCRDRPRSPASA